MKITIHIDKLETEKAYAEGIDLVIEDANLEDFVDLGELSFEDLIALVQQAEAEKDAQEDAAQDTELQKLIKSLEEQKQGFEKMKEEEGKARFEGEQIFHPFFKVLEENVTKMPSNPFSDALGEMLKAQKEGKGFKF